MTASLQALNRSHGTPHGALEAAGTLRFGDRPLHRYRMANGLVLLLLEDHGAPVVSYQTWFRVGSRHERPGKTGLAHLFEHLMFNESENLPAGEFDRRLEAAGGEVNAATWTDWTYYYESVPSSELPLVVELEAERLGRLVLREPQVASEKEVVANERRYTVEDDVEGSASELLFSTAFEHHPYGWPTIGWMEDIQGFTTEDCQRFYATYYAPNNATVVVVGDFDSEALLALIQKHYGGYPAADLPSPPAVQEPAQRVERVRRVTKPTPTDKLLLGYKAPALGDPGYAALNLANEVLFGGKSSRLHRALVRDGELASEARGSLTPFAEPGLYEVWVSLRPGVRAAQALEVVEAELARLARDGLSDLELAKAKNRFELGFLQGMESATGKAEQIGFYETAMGDAQHLFRQLDAHRAVRAEDLRRAVAALTPAQRTTVYVSPSPDAESTP